MRLLITGEGRSGTKWMATFLRECGHSAGHESSRFGGRGWKTRGWQALKQIKAGELPDVDQIIKWIQEAPAGWIEINGYLLWHVPSFVACKRGVLHLVRDGRDVARSFVARKRRSKAALLGAPSGADYVVQLGHRWSEKVRWMRSFRFLRLEDALSNFDLLRDTLRGYGVEVDRGVWEKMRRRRVNATKRHAVSAWPEWGKEKQAAFWRVAGEMMEIYGYERGRYPH